MRIEYEICDIKNCKKRAKGWAFFMGRKMDAAGDVENDFEFVALCEKHEPKYRKHGEICKKEEDVKFYNEIKKKIDINKKYGWKKNE